MRIILKKWDESPSPNNKRQTEKRHRTVGLVKKKVTAHDETIENPIFFSFWQTKNETEQVKFHLRQVKHMPYHLCAL